MVFANSSALGRLSTDVARNVRLDRIFEYPGFNFPGVRTAKAKRDDDLDGERTDRAEQYFETFSKLTDSALAKEMRALCNDLRSIRSTNNTPAKSKSILSLLKPQPKEATTYVSRYLSEYAARALSLRQLAQSRLQPLVRIDGYLKICYQYPSDAEQVQAVESDLRAASEQLKARP